MTFALKETDTPEVHRWNIVRRVTHRSPQMDGGQSLVLEHQWFTLPCAPETCLGGFTSLFLGSLRRFREQGDRTDMVESSTMVFFLTVQKK